jgi:hypothetical protein
MRKSLLTTMTLAAGLMGGALVGIAEDQRSGLLVEYVAPSLLQPAPPPASAAAAPVLLPREPEFEPFLARVSGPRRQLTEGELWERFEAEFAPVETDAGLVQGTLQTAKYQLDRTVFALNQFIENVEDALKFEYELRNLGGRGSGSGASSRRSSQRVSSGNPLLDALDNARLRSDVDLSLSGRAFVGIKLEIPFGD